jgi:hypothetical protein
MAVKNNPELWERVKEEITRGTKGGEPNQWSARKAQLAVLEYKKRGGTYSGAKPTTGLAKWTKQDWRTKSGKPSSETGERYLPAKAIASLTASEYKRTSEAKKRGMKKGEQFVKQPEDIAAKTKKFTE